MTELLTLLTSGQTATSIGQGGNDILSILTMLIPLALMIVIFYFLIIRPEKKRGKKMQEMLNNFSGSVSNLNLSAPQQKNFVALASFGVPVAEMSNVLRHESSDINNLQKEMGIPTDSINGGMSEFQLWVDAARNSSFGSDMKIAIKADAATPYKVVKKMMSELQDMSENRYYLITNLKKEGE